MTQNENLDTLSAFPPSPRSQSFHTFDESEKDNVNMTDINNKFPLAKKISSDSPSEINVENDQFKLSPTSARQQQLNQNENLLLEHDQSLNSFFDNRRRSFSLDLIAGSSSLPSKSSSPAPAIQSPAKVVRFPTSPTSKDIQNKADTNELDLLGLKIDSDNFANKATNNDSSTLIGAPNNLANSPEKVLTVKDNIDTENLKIRSPKVSTSSTKFNITKSNPSNSTNPPNSPNQNSILTDSPDISASDQVNSIDLQPLSNQARFDGILPLQKNKSRSKTLDMSSSNSTSKGINSVSTSPTSETPVKNQTPNPRIIFESPSNTNIPIMSVKSTENANNGSFLPPVGVHQRSYSNTTPLPVSKNKFLISRSTVQDNNTKQDMLDTNDVNMNNNGQINISSNSSNDKNENNIIQLIDAKPIAASMQYIASAVQQDEIGNSSAVHTSDSPLHLHSSRKKKSSRVKSINIKINVDDSNKSDSISSIPSSSFLQSSNENIRGFFKSSDKLNQKQNNSYLQNSTMLPTILEEDENNQFEPLPETTKNNNFEDNFELIPNEIASSNPSPSFEPIPNEEEEISNLQNFEPISNEEEENKENNCNNIELIPISPRNENSDQFELINQNDTLTQPSSSDLLESLSTSTEKYDQFEPIPKDIVDLYQFEPIPEQKDIKSSNQNPNSEFLIDDFEAINKNYKDNDKNLEMANPEFDLINRTDTNSSNYSEYNDDLFEPIENGINVNIMQLNSSSDSKLIRVDNKIDFTSSPKARQNKGSKRFNVKKISSLQILPSVNFEHDQKTNGVKLNSDVINDLFQ